MPVSSGRWPSNSVKASRPPADAPMPTMCERLPSALSSEPGSASVAAESGLIVVVDFFPGALVRRFGRGDPPGRLFTACFIATRHHCLSRRDEPSSSLERERRHALHAPCHSQAHPCYATGSGWLEPANCPNCIAVSLSEGGRAAIPSPSSGFGTCEQIFDGLADLHELIQPGRLGDELGNSEVLEHRLIPARSRRTPHAHWNAVQVPGAPDLAQNVFAVIF